MLDTAIGLKKASKKIKNVETSRQNTMPDHHKQQRLMIQGIQDGSRSFTGPEHVVIDITNHCHNNCIACWTRSPYLGDSGPGKLWHKHQLDTDLVLRLIDDLASLGTSIIRFTGGGEPFLHPHLLDCIRAVKSHGIFCAVTTSLNTVDVAQVDEIVDAGVDELSVSLWASSGAEYVATHPNQSAQTFERITKVLQRIKKRKERPFYSIFSKAVSNRSRIPKINLLHVISNVNCTGVEAMYDYALEVGADSIYYAVVDVIEGTTDVLLLNDAQRYQVLNACEKIEKKNSRLPEKRKLQLDNFSGFRARLKDVQAKTGQYDEERVMSIPCYIGWIFCRIMADGQVVPCCRGVELPMGNLAEYSFTDIWFSEKYNKFRQCALHLNDHQKYFKNVGCEKTCDNHMHNLDMAEKLKCGSS